MDPQASKLVKVDSSEDMEALARKMAAVCPNGSKIYLEGELGAGKTTFVRGFLRGKNYHGKVKSPTYTLIEPYQLEGQCIYHFDFYRINDPMELEGIGLRDYMDGSGICLVEWPEKGNDLLTAPDVMVRIEILEKGRKVILDTHSDVGTRILEQLNTLL